MARRRNCRRRLVSAATGFRSNCGTFRLSAATAKASAKHARSLRRPEQPESISIRFARPCLPTDIAPRLGIEMPRVMSGTYASATITTSQSATALDKSAPAVGTAGALTVSTATPKRVSARLELTLEDIATVGQANFESILRENLALALSDQLDDQVINGNGTAPNLAGIFQGLTDPTAAPTAVADFDAFVAAFAGGVDGLWSNTVKEVAIVGGVETYRLSAATFRDPSTGTAGGRGDKAFSDYGMEHYGAWFWTNSRMPRRGNIHERG